MMMIICTVHAFNLLFCMMMMCITCHVVSHDDDVYSAHFDNVQCACIGLAGSRLPACYVRYNWISLCVK